MRKRAEEPKVGVSRESALASNPYEPMTDTTKTADAALAQHNFAIEQLAQAILDSRDGCYGANWSQAGSAAHVRAILAQAALAAGAITEEQAAAHGA